MSLPISATARDLLVELFTKDLQHRTRLETQRLEPGVALAFAGWLGLRRPPLLEMRNGAYRFTCKTAKDATAISDNFGGDADGRVCAGFVVDLDG